MSRSIPVLSADGIPASPARVLPASRPALRVGAVQHRWHPDPEEHAAALADGVRAAAGAGARVVCLQELTLSPYFAVDPAGPGSGGAAPEPLPGGPTTTFATALAAECGVVVHASLYEADPHGGLGFNTAIAVAPANTAS